MKRPHVIGGQSSAVLLTIALVVALWLGPMTADTLAIGIVIAIAPAATLFSILYTVLAKWWRSRMGRALWTSSTGLALLVDISLLYHWLGDDYALRDVVRISVYMFILFGAYFKLSALVSEQWAKRRQP